MAAGEFIQHFRADCAIRWSPAELAAQQRFAQENVRGDWLDWSSEAAAFELVQASVMNQFFPYPGSFDSLLIASPVAEMVHPLTLFGCAARQFPRAGRLVGIIPCVRDNSPESRLFCEFATQLFWPYFPVEELMEMLGETGWKIADGASSFHPLPRFNEVVLADQLGFKGFRRVFGRLEAEGYDPAEIGWGEARFVAERVSD